MIVVEKDKVIKALYDLGIAEGAIVFVHSSVGLIFGNQRNPSEMLYRAIREVIGETGTIVVPTFSLSCCHGEVFDIDHTESEVGVFSNWVRKLPGALRSWHPIHSVAAIGPYAAEIINHGCKSSFGAESSFNKLLQLKALILLVGVGIKYVTLIHQVEEDLQVPYRFFKEFKIKIKAGNGIREAIIPYYAKYLDRKIIYKINLMEKMLYENKAISSIRIGWGQIDVCAFFSFYNIFLSAIRSDPYVLIYKDKYFESIRE